MLIAWSKLALNHIQQDNLSHPLPHISLRLHYTVSHFVVVASWGVIILRLLQFSCGSCGVLCSGHRHV